MEFDAIEALQSKNASWRLLRAVNAPLILAFLGEFFVEGNRGACPASEITAALDDALYVLNSLGPDEGDLRFPKAPAAYLEDCAAADAAGSMPPWPTRGCPPSATRRGWPSWRRRRSLCVRNLTTAKTPQTPSTSIRSGRKCDWKRPLQL